MLKLSKFISLSLVLWCVALSSQAAYIERTITIDSTGNMADWYDTPPAYTPSGDITNNPGQFSTDPQSGAGDLDSPIAGRDLKKFSFTWDATNIYFYVERYANANNVTHWWFYLDTDADDLMETGEPIFHLTWQGNTRATIADIYTYVEVAAGGDPLTNAGVGDGYTMPGTVTLSQALYSSNDGAASGVAMESFVSWANLGFAGPENIKFHISSSNNTNLPGGVLDNMDGPAGGELFPQDLQVSKIASVTSELSNHEFTYTVQVYNAAIIDFTNVVISDVLPSLITYVGHMAEAGTTFDDSDANSIPDQWNIPTIPANTTFTLTITVKGDAVASTTTTTNTAALTASDQTDDDATNDSASVDVDIEPAPVLTMVKSTTSSTVKTGEDISYKIVVTNIGGASTTPVVVTDALSPYSMLRVNTYGALTPFELTEGAPVSNITLGTMTYSDDNGATFTYTPVSGGGGAPAGYDANVTNWNIDMTGTMAPSGSNFDVQYQTGLR